MQTGSDIWGREYRNKITITDMLRVHEILGMSVSKYSPEENKRAKCRGSIWKFV
jgi:hypothetical protein